MRPARTIEDVRAVAHATGIPVRVNETELGCRPCFVLSLAGYPHTSDEPALRVAHVWPDCSDQAIQHISEQMRWELAQRGAEPLPLPNDYWPWQR